MTLFLSVDLFNIEVQGCVAGQGDADMRHQGVRQRRCADDKARPGGGGRVRCGTGF